MTAMANYSWPGNVRELENTIERAVILSGERIESENLPARIRQESKNAFATRDADGFRPTLEEIERRYVLEVLKDVGEDKAIAANILGIDLSTLYRKLKRYDELAAINGRKAPE
ncbi:MAG TPA: helix-turn-helix domain-containing protein, partial [Pyrinomonadaceae bacterium]|jgi:DNA-binding NtrC family response regulator|nr:helix-turn-helix domain-containing protein [Pyrinomonadaceae bacterium]